MDNTSNCGCGCGRKSGSTAFGAILGAVAAGAIVLAAAAGYSYGLDAADAKGTAPMRAPAAASTAPDAGSQAPGAGEQERAMRQMMRLMEELLAGQRSPWAAPDGPGTWQAVPGGSAQGSSRECTTMPGPQGIVTWCVGQGPLPWQSTQPGMPGVDGMPEVYGTPVPPADAYLPPGMPQETFPDTPQGSGGPWPGFVPRAK